MEVILLDDSTVDINKKSDIDELVPRFGEIKKILIWVSFETYGCLEYLLSLLPLDNSVVFRFSNSSISRQMFKKISELPNIRLDLVKFTCQDGEVAQLMDAKNIKYNYYCWGPEIHPKINPWAMTVFCESSVDVAHRNINSTSVLHTSARLIQRFTPEIVEKYKNLGIAKIKLHINIYPGEDITNIDLRELFTIPGLETFVINAAYFTKIPSIDFPDVFRTEVIFTGKNKDDLIELYEKKIFDARNITRFKHTKAIMP